MPNVFENFFNQFDRQPSDYYDLIRLNPSYQVKFKEESIDFPTPINVLEELFESTEAGMHLNFKNS